ncbi:MAG TPA: UDP-glucose/GDP-mannose dehydrogenase family protein [Oligoflexia bacterium]|nr:UDP-glucose/GDP-mannose dehydrogenase family protein [Oligoflexia bacterium]HMR23801.1 UDP-glucose/GDP-mannose dehydrogenase family protein [Oligoflexia bacterium]
MKIAVVGTGYVGLVTGTCFAETGNQVMCLDLDQSKIEQLKQAKVPFFEPGLEDLVEKNSKQGKLKFTTNADEAFANAQIALICVGTPSSDNGSANLEYVYGAARDIAKHAPKDLILITKSTVPVGTGDEVEKIVRNEGRDDIVVVSNPEFLREGSAVQDCMYPDRVVIGTENARAKETLTKLYESFVRSGKPILSMKRRSAEMAKYGANSLLACRISFINEMSRICENVGADIQDVRIAMGTDNRIGMQYLYPSIGFGGSCFPKDVRALEFLAKEHGMQPDLLTATLQANEKQKDNYVSKITEHFGGKESLKGKKIAVWGVAFKAKTDDIRESPSLHVMDKLIALGADIHSYDPEANQNTNQHYGSDVTVHEDMYTAIEGADALCVLTEWNEFRSPDFSRIASVMKTPTLFDGRNLYDVKQLSEFNYYRIG